MLQCTCVILVSDKQNGLFALIQKVDTAPGFVTPAQICQGVSKVMRPNNYILNNN